MATTKETYTFPGTEWMQRAKDLFHESNITRIRLKRKDKTLIDVTLAQGAAMAAAGFLAALGSYAVMANDSVVEVEREGKAKAEAAPPASTAAADHEELRQHIEDTIKSELRYFARAKESDDWDEIGKKVASRVWARIQEDRKRHRIEVTTQTPAS